MKRLSIVTAFFLAMKVFGFAAEDVAPYLPSVKVGDLAPDAPVQERKNHSSSDTLLLARSTGKFALIEFSQTTCGGCQATLPAFLKLAEKIKAVSVTKLVYGDRSSAILDKFVEANSGLEQVEVIHDGSRAVFKTYGIKGTPTTLVIGPDNKLRFVHLGDLDDSTQQEILKIMGLNQ